MIGPNDLMVPWGGITHGHPCCGLVLYYIGGWGLAMWLVLTNEMLVDVMHTEAWNVLAHLALLSCMLVTHREKSMPIVASALEWDTWGRSHAPDGPGKPDLDSNWSLKSNWGATDPQNCELESAWLLL